jgi:molybdopterin synthase sulfur carrier subunit
VEVNFYATLRAVVGARSVEVPVAGEISVRALLDRVVARYPAVGPYLLDERGELHRHVHVFINGRDVPYLPGGLETQVGARDTVDLFPAVAGG